jgi:hypothetical protein
MKKLPASLNPLALRDTKQAGGELAERTTGALAEPATQAFGPFFGFRYSYTEVSAHGDKARVKRRETRLENGKLASESFDGELERAAFDDLMNQARDRFVQQAELLMRPWSWFLPTSRKSGSDRD